MMRLHSTLPEGYLSHGTSGEHASKHIGHLGGVNRLRVEFGDGGRYSDDELWDTMYWQHGFAYTALAEPDGGEGEIVGYAMAQRASDAPQLVVTDLVVNPDHAEQNLDGYMVGKLVHTTHVRPKRGFDVQDFPEVLQIGEEMMSGPGRQISVSMFYRDGPEVKFRLEENRPTDWTGMFSTYGPSGDSHELYRDGIVVGSITDDDEAFAYRLFRGRFDELLLADTFDSEVFAAIDLLWRLEHPDDA